MVQKVKCPLDLVVLFLKEKVETLVSFYSKSIMALFDQQMRDLEVIKELQKNFSHQYSLPLYILLRLLEKKFLQFLLVF